MHKHKLMYVVHFPFNKMVKLEVSLIFFSSKEVLCFSLQILFLIFGIHFFII